MSQTNFSNGVILRYNYNEKTILKILPDGTKYHYDDNEKLTKKESQDGFVISYNNINPTGNQMPNETI